MQQPPTSPQGLYSTYMAFDGQHVVLFLTRYGGTVQGDTWTWDGTTWTHHAGTASPNGGSVRPLASALGRGGRSDAELEH